MKPDLDTLRPVPVARGHRDGDGRPPVARRRPTWSPRRGRSCAASSPASPSAGWSAIAGTELEFIVFNDTYEDAWRKGYRDLEPANLYNVDYSLLGTARVEPLIRRIRNEMAGAGMRVENSKGECNLGQHEINFRYGEALPTADDHVDLQERRQGDRRPGGHAITFMAKFNEREGNSCHIHCSLAGRGRARTSSRRDQQLFDHFVAGQLACMRELTPLLRARTSTPTSASPRARSPRPPSPGASDNRTCSLRVVGHGEGAAGREPAAGRRRQPLPGAGGDDRRRAARDRRRARRSSRPSRATPTSPTSRACPTNLYEARDLFAASEVAREAFGAGGGRPLPEPRPGRARGVRERAVTDWERFRGFERLVSAPRHRHLRRDRAGALGRLGRRGERLASGPTREAVVEARRAAGHPAARRRSRPTTPTSCSTCSTGCCSPAAPTSTRPPTAPRPTETRPAPGPSATASSSRCSARRSSGDMPLLGICRGMQMLNVALRRHARPAPRRTRRRAHHRTRPATFCDHEVRLEPGSLAARAGGRRAPAGEVAPPSGGRPARRGPRGQRAVGRATTWSRRSSCRSASYALGVLWHPEEDERSALIVTSSRGAVERAERGGGRMIDVIEPATERGDGRGAAGRRGGGRRGGRARARRALPGRGARSRPPTARELLRAARRRARGRRRRSWRRSRRATPASRSATRAARSGWSSRPSATTPARRERLLGKTIPVAGGVDMTFREPLGVVGLIVPWNFPLVIASWKVGPGARRGQHGRAQAGRADAADRARARADRARGRPARGRAQRRRRARARSAGSGSSSTRTSPRSPSPARPRSGRGIAAGRRADDQAGDARARRQVGQRRLRRRRPRGRGRRGAGRRVRQRRPGLLRALAHPRRARRRSTTSWRRSRRRSSSMRRRRPARRGRPRWAR